MFIGIIRVEALPCGDKAGSSYTKRLPVLEDINVARSLQLIIASACDAWLDIAATVYHALLREAISGQARPVQQRARFEL